MISVGTSMKCIHLVGCISAFCCMTRKPATSCWVNVLSKHTGTNKIYYIGALGVLGWLTHGSGSWLHFQGQQYKFGAGLGLSETPPGNPQSSYFTFQLGAATAWLFFLLLCGPAISLVSKLYWLHAHKLTCKRLAICLLNLPFLSKLGNGDWNWKGEAILLSAVSRWPQDILHG